VRQRARGLAAAAGLALAAAVAAGPAPAEPALAIDVRTPLFAGSDLVVEVRQAGDLAGRPLAVQLAVDGVAVGRFETTGSVTELRAPAPVASGHHEILVKSGSRRAATTVRVWPGWTLPAAGAAALALGALAFGVYRRRRASAG
jgi:hypothetical protein